MTVVPQQAYSQNTRADGYGYISTDDCSGMTTKGSVVLRDGFCIHVPARNLHTPMLGLERTYANTGCGTHSDIMEASKWQS